MNAGSLRAAAALLAVFALPAGSLAATAYSVGGTVNMRTGPGTHYPVIAQIPSGSRIDVVACLQDYSWCDTVVADLRGWVSTRRLEFPHGGRNVPLRSFYTFFNAPIFSGGAPNRQGPDPAVPDCADPNTICPGEEPVQGPVECESCPWPTGRRQDGSEGP